VHAQNSSAPVINAFFFMFEFSHIILSVHLGTHICEGAHGMREGPGLATCIGTRLVDTIDGSVVKVNRAQYKWVCM
jgi:hypothetical protein